MHYTYTYLYLCRSANELRVEVQQTRNQVHVCESVLNQRDKEIEDMKNGVKSALQSHLWAQSAMEEMMDATDDSFAHISALESLLARLSREVTIRMKFDIYVYIHVHIYMYVCIFLYPCSYIFVFAYLYARGYCKFEYSYLYLHECLYSYSYLHSYAIKEQVSFAEEPYKRDHILQKRPIFLRSLLIIATPY